MSNPRVTAIIPARNEEANIARSVFSLASQPEIAEIIVVNDQSTDRTPAILAELQLQVPSLQVMDIAGVPSGWLGKANALARGASAAHEQWLLFTDADTFHLPGSTASALADAVNFGASLVSYSPEQETSTWWERALIPFVFCRLSQLFSFAAVNDPASPAAAANGQYLLIRRGVYEHIGGHAAVRGDILEDVALATLAKRAGHRIFFAPGQGIARTRMYRSFAAMWEGWTKNLYLLVGGSNRALLRELLSVFPWIPLVLMGLGCLQPVFFWVGLLFLVGRHIVYGGILRRNRYPLPRIIYYLPAVLLYAAALLASARRWSRGRVVWKGREYSVESQ